jgi:hypothetical protein
MQAPARAAIRVVAAAIIIAVLGGSCPSSARAAGAIDPTDHVPDHPDVTYFDVVKQVVTDLDDLPRQGLPRAGEPTAHTIVPYRHIEGADAKTNPAGPVAIQLLTARSIRAAGQARLVLMIDLGPSDEAVAAFTLLALFDMAERPKLLDVVEVGTDRLTGFVDKPLPLGHGTDIVVIDSDHFNSNEDFVGTELVFVRNDRFQLAGTLFTFDVKTCTSVRSQLPAVTTRPDARRRYHRIDVAVHETVVLQPDRDGCSGEKVPRPFKRTYRAIYRWNAQQDEFQLTAGDLKRLDRENKKLMSGDD